jgi:integrase
MSKRRAHGEGTITKRKDGRWEARYTPPDGRRKALYAKTQAEVRARLTAALRDRDVGLPAAGDERQTLADWLHAWLAAAKPTVRVRTWRRYEEYVRIHLIPTIGRIRLARLTPNHVQQLYARKLEEGLSAQTVRHLHAVLRRALNEAVRQGVVPRNVATIARPPKAPRHEIQVLSAAQVLTLLDSLEGDRFEALYTVALSTGMRLGELLALRWRDVDLTYGRLQVRQTLHYLRAGGYVFAEPKTSGSRRSIDLTAAALDALRRHRVRQNEQRLALGAAWQDNDLVFPRDDGAPAMDTSITGYHHKKILARAGLPAVRFHDLRHTAASLMLAGQVNPKVVSEILGHASVRITLDIYAHVLPGMQQSAVAALDAALARRPSLGQGGGA